MAKWGGRNVNTAAKRTIGQKKRSFICSHVDSFTPENGAIQAAPPSQSYAKCKSVPINDVSAKPKNCHNQTDLFIYYSDYFLK